MEVKTIDQVVTEMKRAFSDAHAFAGVARRPNSTRRDASIQKMFMCRAVAHNAIAYIKALRKHAGSAS